MSRAHNPKVAGKCPEWVSSPAPATFLCYDSGEIRSQTSDPGVVSLTSQKLNGWFPEISIGGFYQANKTIRNKARNLQIVSSNRTLGTTTTA